MNSLFLRRRNMMSSHTSNINYFRIYSPSGADFSIHVETPGWNNKIQYSVGNNVWYDWDGSIISTSDIYFRGINNYTLTGGNVNRNWLINSEIRSVDIDIVLEGDLETLLNYRTVLQNQHPEAVSRCFMYLFSENSMIKDISNLIFPNLTTVSDRCYAEMFKGCTSLVSAPELPSEQSGSYSYASMFEGCTSLVNPPSTLPRPGNHSYYGMFKNCTSLIETPTLPYNSIEAYCYTEMFKGCTSLVFAPELPATELDTACYFSMFEDCTSLLAFQELPATQLASGCYGSMFKGCTSLWQTPRILATNFVYGCCSNMFENCTSLASALDLSDKTPAHSCCFGMFRNCTSLRIPPELPTGTDWSSYESMFEGCTYLGYLPRLPATELYPECYHYMFKNTPVRIYTTYSNEHPYVFMLPTTGEEATKLDTTPTIGMFSSTLETEITNPDVNITYYSNTPTSTN